MTISEKELKQLAHLAYLDIENTHSLQLIHEINEIMDFVATLKTMNTQHISPLCHPLSAVQRLRQDDITETSCLAELETVAPLFEENFYLVPQVIDEV